MRRTNKVSKRRANSSPAEQVNFYIQLLYSTWAVKTARHKTMHTRRATIDEEPMHACGVHMRLWQPHAWDTMRYIFSNTNQISNIRNETLTLELFMQITHILMFASWQKSIVYVWCSKPTGIFIRNASYRCLCVSILFSPQNLKGCIMFSRMLWEITFTISNVWSWAATWCCN